MTALARPSTGGARNLGLDVVRATAILMVMFCHFGQALLFALGLSYFDNYGPAQAGFFGVELFFVLSGFLIGRILLDIARTGPTAGALLIFLTRRWMRTLPLYLVWVALLWAFLPYLHVSLGFALRYATLTQNLYSGMPDNNWFGVSWSLTVEEWFYLLFGSSVILSAALLPYRFAIWLPIAIFLIVPTVVRCTMPLGALHNASRQVALLRLDAIAYGAAMAAISLHRPTWLKYPRTLLCIGLVLIVAAWENVAGWFVPWHMRGSFMLTLSSLGLVLCLPAAVRIEHAHRWFEAAARAISAQSYGLYIMHLTFMDLAFWSVGAFPWINWPVALAASLAITVGLSWLSFRYFESPILHLRPAQTRGRPRSRRELPAADAAPNVS
jgi:peptidoglycan/LPS O-acetylase OafA/YrhL